ncbi:hypothetical protein G7Y89_g6180 [Cudoniella acicularis]|uniref:non-specific serine/threonine protein kinase n=1 Tax=Cudoniella acicularis TaxID=354080 RepID=A0A8H4W3A0_9HELO|nr:hypothetical protein G7Y89_g6180 [Cudoniella acicularis]
MYLQPPVEEFIDTGVDPTKAITAKTIAPHASPAVQEKLHIQVTEKISKTMGYGMKDVQEALAAEEPSAIKDAYLIVRENKLMQANPNLADDKGQLLFQAPSPPAWNDGIRLDSAISPPPSPVVKDPAADQAPPLSRPSPLVDAMSPRSSSSIGTDRSIRPYVSKIGILPSSLPAYHRDFMEARKNGRDVGKPLSNTHSETDSPTPQTEAEKAETARRLNPHSRSQIKLDEASKRPAGMTPVPQKKTKPTKWQFGIRSRNQPLEAIGCIYRALQKLGAEWVVDEDWEPHEEYHEDRFVLNASGASLHHSESMNDADRSSLRFNRVDPDAHYKLPADPWVLRVRWRKDDLRRHSIASISSAGGSQEVPSPPKPTKMEPVDTVVMHLDIQLYEMEPGVYLVDFKCAGYETPEGMLLEEKEVTSPFPFLDLASKLIIQLAEAD